jgi:hypothetical protein
MPTKISPEILAAAIEGFEAQKKNIDAQIAELRHTLSGGPVETPATPEAHARKRKGFSAGVRRKMALAQKARWAKIRGESEPTEPAATKAKEAPKAKRRISAEGMKRIIAATKKRWRLAKAAKTVATATKKAAPVAKKVAVKKAAPKGSKKVARKSAPVKRVAKAATPSSAQATTGTVAES